MTIVYAPPNQEKTDPDYATITELKDRLGIEALNTDLDDRLTLALITAEVKIEEHLGRAFPDLGNAQVFSSWKSIGEGSIAAVGEVSSFAATSVELSKVNYNEAQFTLELVDVTVIAIGSYSLAVSSFVETDELWTFTGTATGTFPDANTLVEVLIGQIALAGTVIDVVPETVHTKALNLAMLEYKKTDSPTGTAGSDAFIGELNVNDSIRAELNDRTLLGLKIEWGVS